MIPVRGLSCFTIPGSGIEVASEASGRDLPSGARAEVVFVSAASAWEAVIKASLGKLRFPGSFEGAVEDSDFAKLEVTFAHVEALRDLPNHHADPFDRMLIAQTRCEGLTVVTRDPQFTPYGVPILPA